MKWGFVVLIFLVLLFVLWRTDALQIRLLDRGVEIFDKRCKLAIPAERLETSRDLVDEVRIERTRLRLANGQEIVYESADLDPKHDFGIPYEELVGKLFGCKGRVLSKKEGALFVECGDFVVGVFYKSTHDLVLLYPLIPATVGMIEKCRYDAAMLPKDMPLRPTKWDIRLIILDGLIKKNI